VTRLRLLVEGWRFNPTSLAVVNVYQLLALLDRSDVELFHRDVPYWNERFTHMSGLWAPPDEERLRLIPAPTDSTPIDVTLRIEFPIRPSPDPRARRTFVFTLAEWGIIEDVKCGGLVARDVLARRDISYLTAAEFSRQGFLRTSCPPDNCYVVPHGVDPTLMRPLTHADRETLRAAFGWTGKFVCLNVGTLSVNKGVVGLLRGFAQAAAQLPQAVLYLKGSNKLSSSDAMVASALSALPAAARELLDGRLAYAGQDLSFAQIAALYQAADCLSRPLSSRGLQLTGPGGRRLRVPRDLHGRRTDR
jgi:glycosyltransferase involved in cell wall biosynthesis